MSVPRWEDLRRDLPRPSLIDVYADGLSPEDWENVYQFATQTYLCSFGRDGEDAPLPALASEIQERSQRQAPRLWIDVRGVRVCWFFFFPEEPTLELDFDPEEIPSQRAFEGILRFLERLASVLRRPVRMTSEGFPDITLLEIQPTG
jgi:hypothetical protein